MKFLETITGWGHEVLVPIDRIKFVYIKDIGDPSWAIVIESDDGDWVEIFGKDEKRLEKRLQEIKQILNGK